MASQQADKLARWQSHKIVRAAKIVAVNVAPDHWLVEGADGKPMLYRPPLDICARGRYAEPGDYLVVYDDSYTSWSPSSAFEAGYTKVPVDRGVDRA
jgi:hypothetical protein